MTQAAACLVAMAALAQVQAQTESGCHKTFAATRADNSISDRLPGSISVWLPGSFISMAYRNSEKEHLPGLTSEPDAGLRLELSARQ